MSWSRVAGAVAPEEGRTPEVGCVASTLIYNQSVDGDDEIAAAKARDEIGRQAFVAHKQNAAAVWRVVVDLRAMNEQWNALDLDQKKA